MKRWRKLSIILVVLCAGLAGFWLGRTSYPTSEDTSRFSRLEQENQKLQAALEKLRSGNIVPPDAPGQVQVAQGKSSTRSPRKVESLPAEIAGQLRTLQESLASANQSLTATQAEAKELQTQLHQSREEVVRLAARESALAGQLTSAGQLAETRGAELSRKTEQVAMLESGQKLLREDSASTAQKASQQLQVLHELQEVYRRRESYLTTLMARYREVTEQYRAFASVLENRRGPEGTSGAGISIAGPELGRIQNSITMAEEDLRQLNSMNAQVLRLQKKLPAK